MQNEILKPVLATDETAIPRYDIVNPDGSVSQQNVELRLKNEVMQQGTPYDEDSVLPATLCEKLGLPNSATPANAFEAVLAKAGAKVSMNEPTSQDNIAAGYSIGALWLRIPFTLNNRSFLATAQEFVASACTVEKTNQTFVLTGNGDDKILSATYALSYTDGWLYAKISVDETATSASVTIGDYAVQLTPGNTNSICIKYTGNAVAFSATYATANAESSGVVTIENFTVLDKDAVMQSGVDAGSDITTDTISSILAASVPFSVFNVPTRLAQHVNDGTWELIYGVDNTTLDMYKLSHSSSLNDILQKLAMPYGYYGFDITTVFEDGTIVPYVVLNGLTDISGNVAITDSTGRCRMAMTDTATPTVSINSHIGIVNTDVVISANPSVVFTPITITLTRDYSMKLIQSSGKYRVLTGETIDMCLVGGGASGVTPNSGSWATGAGGGGGYVTNVFDIVINNAIITLAVGSGGGRASDYKHHAGGNTSVVYDDLTIIANGATNATGNGNGGSSANGTNGSTHVFNDESLPLPGGGGGGGRKATSSPYTGGADFGGNGICFDQNHTYVSASGGTGPGGGGGGGLFQTSGASTGWAGSGANGGLYIRVTHKVGGAST